MNKFIKILHFRHSSVLGLSYHWNGIIYNKSVRILHKWIGNIQKNNHQSRLKNKRSTYKKQRISFLASWGLWILLWISDWKIIQTLYRMIQWTFLTSLALFDQVESEKKIEMWKFTDDGCSDRHKTMTISDIDFWSRRAKNKYINSQTCIKRSPLGQRKKWSFKTGDFWNSHATFYDGPIKMWPFKTGDCLIEVTAWTSLTVLCSVFSHYEQNLWSYNNLMFTSEKYSPPLFPDFVQIPFVDPRPMVTFCFLQYA